MASVESSTLTTKFLVLAANIQESQNNNYEVITYGEHDNVADAVSAMNDLQAVNTATNFYVVEALTALPNPAE